MRRSAAFLLAAALLVLTRSQAAFAEPGTAVRIRGIDTRGFPEVSVTVSITGQEVTADDLLVTESGRPVPRPTVRSLEQSGRRVDVVLALDVSSSMLGEPLSAAVAAGLRFITSLPDHGIRLGVVTFAERPRVLQPLTTHYGEALQSLGRLTTEQGTALYDAVAVASRMFSGPAQRNILLLSDGGDRSSRSSLAKAIAAARARHASVLAVGLRSPDTNVAALERLAKATGGRYVPAETADLSTVYAGLASELTHQYVVSYLSPAKAGSEVSVQVSAFGSSDAAVVLVPEPKPAAPLEFPPSQPGHAILGGTIGMVLVLVLAFGATFLLLVMFLGTRARARRQHELVKRMAASPEPVAEQERAERVGPGAWIPELLVQAADRAARAGGFGARITERLERASVPLRTGEFVSIMGIAWVAGAGLGALLLRNVIFALLIGSVASTIPPIMLRIAAARRTKKLHGQLADVLMILASSLRAGHSFMQSLEMVSQEIGEPAAAEFSRVVTEARLGRPVDEALNAMAERVGSDDFKWAVLGINVQRDVGGNLAEILDTVAETIRERDAIRRQIDTLTAEGRLSIGILASLPVFVMLYMSKVNPEYLKLLFTTRAGLVMLVTAGALLAVGIFWMRKIVRIDV